MSATNTGETERWGSTVGVATWSTKKFEALAHLAQQVGVSSQLVQLEVPFNLEEGLATSPREAGTKKIEHFAPAINGFLSTLPMHNRPDTVQVMDVLPIAQIDSWPRERRVLKKPAKEEGTCLEVTTDFFAGCLDSDTVQSNRQLEIIYYLVHAFSPVDRRRGKIDTAVREVVYDDLRLTFSLPLLEILSDPGRLRKMAKRHPVALAELLTEESVRGFRMSVLMPIVATLAAQNRDDGLWVGVDYSRPIWHRDVDDRCDLREERVPVGVTMQDGTQDMRLQPFVYNASQNVTPWLVAKSLLGKRSRLLLKK